MFEEPFLVDLISYRVENDPFVGRNWSINYVTQESESLHSHNGPFCPYMEHK